MDRDSLTGLTVGPLVGGVFAGWPRAKSILGRYVLLESLDPPQHTRGLWEVVGGEQNAALWQYMAEGPFNDEAQFAKAMQDAAAPADRVFFVITDAATRCPRPVRLP